MVEKEEEKKMIKREWERREEKIECFLTFKPQSSLNSYPNQNHKNLVCSFLFKKKKGGRKRKKKEEEEKEGGRKKKKQPVRLNSRRI